MTRGFFIAFSLLLLLAEVPQEADCSAAEVREILRNLNARGQNDHLVRPDGAGGENSPLVVELDFNFVRLVDVDAEHGVARTAGYLLMKWTDQRLSYNHLTFRGRQHNVSSLHLDSSSVWTPDIEMYNSDSPSMKSLSKDYRVVVRPGGEMLWVPRLTFNSFCEQLTPPEAPGPRGLNCTMTLGSWTYSGTELDLRVHENPDLKWNSSLPQWRVASSAVKRVEKHYDCCPEPYFAVVYSFQLFRR